MSKMNRISLLTTPGHFRAVLLPYVSKNDDEERCFLKWYGFNQIQYQSLQNFDIKEYKWSDLEIKVCTVNEPKLKLLSNTYNTLSSLKQKKNPTE